MTALGQPEPHSSSKRRCHKDIVLIVMFFLRRSNTKKCGINFKPFVTSLGVLSKAEGVFGIGTLSCGLLLCAMARNSISLHLNGLAPIKHDQMLG